MSMEKAKEFLIPAKRRSKRFGLIERKLIQLRTLQLNQVFSNAFHFTMNLWQKLLKTTSHPFICLMYSNCERKSISYSEKCGRVQIRLKSKMQLFFHIPLDASATFFYVIMRRCLPTHLEIFYFFTSKRSLAG